MGGGGGGENFHTTILVTINVITYSYYTPQPGHRGSNLNAYL